VPVANRLPASIFGPHQPRSERHRVEVVDTDLGEGRRVRTAEVAHHRWYVGEQHQTSAWDGHGETCGGEVLVDDRLDADFTQCEQRAGLRGEIGCLTPWNTMFLATSIKARNATATTPSTT
jgi:hypothetical protein